MVRQRVLETIAMLMVGDGVIATINPRRHGLLWLKGPESWQNAMRPFIESPTLMRSMAVAEIALGLWLARRQQPAPN